MGLDEEKTILFLKFFGPHLFFQEKVRKLSIFPLKEI